jgi:beta-catenin-like protein 1
VSEKQTEILDFMDEQEKELAEPEMINAAWLRKKALGFERLINKNAEMRGKFEDEPHKFVFPHPLHV